MASDAPVAKLLAHIAACHSAKLPGGRLPFYIGAAQVGYVKPDFAAILARVSAEITLYPDQATLAASAAGKLNEIAAAAGSRQRSEDFDVRAEPEGPVVALLDRGALPDFGVIGVGAHLNGLVRKPDGLHLWVAKRAADKKLDPGKLDHLVAGGVPAGLTPFETLLKEGEEEANLPPKLMRAAKPVCRLRYNMERPEGLRRDLLYAYDLVLPEDFSPHPNDGEVESFALWPLTRVLETISQTDDFKFNVNLVLIDLLIRHGQITGPAAATLRAALDG
jgi:8-oxo-dGTP pyrophosphatase MutT (NUDIX family)